MSFPVIKVVQLGLIGLILAHAVGSVSGLPSSGKAQVESRVAALRRMFNFQPIPQEGGFYFSTYHSAVTLPPNHPGGAPRLAGSAIYFLLAPGDFSALHKLKEDEIYHFYDGSPVELLQLFPDGTGIVTVCGPEFWKGQQPQVVVRAGVWQGSRPLQPDNYALLGTTMTPGFDPSDFDLGKRDELQKAYPSFAAKIKALTRE